MQRCQEFHVFVCKYKTVGDFFFKLLLGGWRSSLPEVLLIVSPILETRAGDTNAK